MIHFVADASSVINLLSFGNAASPARSLRLLVGPGFAREALFVYADDERERKIRIDDALIGAAGILIIPGALDNYEVERYVAHAQMLDDGEAEALAIAEARALPLLIDDARGIRRAKECAVNVVTTLDLLHKWSESATTDALRIAARRLQGRGRYEPPLAHPLRAWYALALDKEVAT